ncbi:MAG TPA: hypothetical protein P5096_01235 [Patescibacteria group bacterium]|nr:hypothetical protein [Patescibacteria group bacterium]
MTEKFDPSKPEYKKVEDLPEDQQPRFENVEGGGFVNKAALELSKEDAQEKATKINEWVNSKRKGKYSELDNPESSMVFENKIETYDILKQRLEKFDDITERVENLILEGGDFDVLRPGFWKDMVRAEMELDPARGGLSWKIAIDIGIRDSHMFFSRIIALDIFHSLKKKGLLDDNDKKLFLKSMPVFELDSIYTRGRSLSPTALLGYENELLDSLEKLSQRENRDEINKEINERSRIHRSIFDLHRSCNRHFFEDSGFSDMDEFIKDGMGEKQFRTYNSFRSGIDKSLIEYEEQNEFKYRSGLAGWDDSYPRNAFTRGMGDIDVFIDLAKDAKNKTENEIEQDKKKSN